VKIGNDIIDLSYWLPLNKASNPRYIDKICTKKEKQTLAFAKNPNLMLMQLWSMKEAAYKVAIKLGAKRAFIPKRLECRIIDERRGLVCSEWGEMETDTEGNANYIHTIANSDMLDPLALCFEVMALDNFKPAIQSIRLRKALFLFLSTKLSLDIEQFEVKTITSIPRFFIDGRAADLEFSISHDAGWGAFCVKL